MSRRSIAKKRYPAIDSKYNSFLVSLFIGKILKQGKKQLSNFIIFETFEIIKKKTNIDPLYIFETAIKNITPRVEIKTKRKGGSTKQIPLEVNRYRGTIIALRWLINAAQERSARMITIKLANEIMDAYNCIGNAVRKRDETHKMSKAIKAFSHI